MTKSAQYTRNSTNKLVPRITNKHMELVDRPNFFLAQAVTGHGAFGQYLHRIGKRTTPQYTCGEELQTPEHVFMRCQSYNHIKKAGPQIGEMECHLRKSECTS